MISYALKIVLKTGLTLFALLAISAPCQADSGPLPLQNRFPLHFLFLTPQPISPRILETGELCATVGLEYSSINFEHRNTQWNFLMDMELATADLTVSYGVSRRWAVGMDLTLASLQDGYLDGFLENYHNALNVPNYGREDRPQNTFGYVIGKDGDIWISGETTGWALADSTITVAYAWPDPSSAHTLTGQLLGRVKLPMGDPDLGLGSGHYDVGLYWAAAWRFERWSYYLMPGLAWISDPDTQGADISARNCLSLFGGIAYQSSDKWQWILQLNGYGSPVESTRIGEVDDGSLELGLGFRYQLTGRCSLVFAFGEDLALAGPDFTVHLGISWSPDLRLKQDENGDSVK